MHSIHDGIEDMHYYHNKDFVIIIILLLRGA